MQKEDGLGIWNSVDQNILWQQLRTCRYDAGSYYDADNPSPSNRIH